MIQVHAHKGVARLEHREKHCHVRLGAGMRLDIYILAAEQLLRALSRQVFRHIHALASAVVSFPRIAFCILIRKRASHRCHHCLTHPVLGRDQLDMGILSLHLCFDHICDLWVCVPDFVKVVHSDSPPLIIFCCKKHISAIIAQLPPLRLRMISHLSRLICLICLIILPECAALSGRPGRVLRLTQSQTARSGCSGADCRTAPGLPSGR